MSLKQLKCRFPPHPTPFHSSPSSTLISLLACSSHSGSVPFSQFLPYMVKYSLGSGITGAIMMSRPLMAVNLAGSQEESFINWDKRFKKKKNEREQRRRKKVGEGKRGKGKQVTIVPLVQYLPSIHWALGSIPSTKSKLPAGVGAVQ